MVVVSGFSRTVEQSDRRIERCGTQVHVPLRRREILMTGELLDCPRRRATHRQMRTERVPQDVNAWLRSANGQRLKRSSVLDAIGASSAYCSVPRAASVSCGGVGFEP